MAGFGGPALGLVGAVVGSYFGPLGASVGYMIGSMVGNLIFPPPGQTFTGPRLEDLTVASSAEGTARPMGWGTFPVAAQILWATEIIEREEKAGGGKGGASMGGSAEYKVYKYYANLALGFGEPGRLSINGGKAVGVIEFYGDGKLIAQTGLEGIEPGSVMEAFLTAWQSKSGSGFRVRFYPGSETQTPDPLIEEHVGVGNAPAFRGEVYVVLENFPLEDFGNRIPNFTAVVAYEGAIADGNRAFTKIPNSDTYSYVSLGINYDLDVAYVATDPTSAPIHIRKINPSTFSEVQVGPDLVRWGPGSGDEGVSNIRVAPYTGLIFANGSDGGVNGDCVVIIDPATLQIVGQFGEPDANVANIAPTAGAPFGKMLGSALAVNELFRIDGLIETYGLAGFDGTTGRPSIYRLWDDQFQNIQTTTLGRIEYVWGADSSVDWIKRHANECLTVVGCAGRAWIGECDFFTGSSNGSTWTAGLYRIMMQQSARYLLENQSHAGVFMDRIVDDIGISFGNGDNIQHIMFDRTDENVIVVSDIGGLGTSTRWQKWDRDGNLIWDTGTIAFAVPAVDTAGRNDILSQSRLITQDVCFTNASEQTLHIDLATGDYTIGTTAIALGGAMAFDSLTGSVIHESGPFAIEQFFCDRLSPGGELLSNIVSDVATRAGYDVLSDHNVAELTDIVPGFATARPAEARSVISALAPLYSFEATEADFKILYRKISKSLADSIVKAEIIPQEGVVRQTIGDQRKQDVEIPRVVSLGYIDRNNQWQPGMQQARRLLHPTPSMHSDNKARLDPPISLTPVVAAEMCETMLWRAWTERVEIAWRTAWEFLPLTPTDVVDLTVDNAVYRTRIVSMNVGADNTIEFSGITHETPIFTLSEIPSTAVSSDAPAQTLQGYAVGQIGFLDAAPLLRSQDDSSNSIPIYFGCWANPTFQSQTIYKRSATGDYIAFARCTHEATTGITEDALGDVAVGAFFVDTTNTVTIRLLEGDDLPLVTQTDAQWRANGLPLLIGAEVVSVKTVVDNGDGTFTLSNFLRGRLGTEASTGGHAIGERWWMLSIEDLHLMEAPLADKGAAQLYKSVADGQAFELAPAVSYTASARTLKPYAVAELTAVNNGGDIDITWEPRSRYESNMRDSVEAYFESETAPAYEIDIISNGAVIRTFSVSTNAVTYTVANQLVDFGGSAGEITISVYKTYSIFGRGYPATIEHVGGGVVSVTAPTIVGTVTELAVYNTVAEYETFNVTPSAGSGTTMLVLGIAYGRSTSIGDDFRFLDMQGGSSVKFAGQDMQHVPRFAQIYTTSAGTHVGMMDMFYLLNPGTDLGAVEIVWPGGITPQSFVAFAFVVQDVNPNVPLGTARAHNGSDLADFDSPPTWPTGVTQRQWNDEGTIAVQWFKDTDQPTLGLMLQCQHDPRKLAAFRAGPIMSAVDFASSTGTTTQNTAAVGYRLGSVPLVGDAGSIITGYYNTEEYSTTQPRESADIFIEVNGV